MQASKWFPEIDQNPFGHWLVLFFGIGWLIIFLIVFPIRVFLDRWEFKHVRHLREQWNAGDLALEELTPTQKAAILFWTHRWPKGLGWLGSKWIERTIKLLLYCLGAVLIVPFIVGVVMLLLMKLSH